MSARGEDRAAEVSTAIGREPYSVVCIGPGVEVVLEHDPDGFLGRDLCVCGEAEDDHVYIWKWIGGGRGRSKSRACKGFVPKRRAPMAEAVQAINHFFEEVRRPDFARSDFAKGMQGRPDFESKKGGGK